MTELAEQDVPAGPPAAEAELLRSSEVMERTGASYRQLDYWTRQELTVAERDLSNEAQARLAANDLEPTSGHARGWSPAEVEVIRRAVLVCRAFPHLTTNAVVFRIARADGPLDLGGGIVVTTPWSAP